MLSLPSSVTSPIEGANSIHSDTSNWTLTNPQDNLQHPTKSQTRTQRDERDNETDSKTAYFDQNSTTLQKSTERIDGTSFLSKTGDTSINMSNTIVETRDAFVIISVNILE